MNAKIQSMTTGQPWKMILLVALPLMLGNVFQQAYTVVDTMVVGQVLGVSALAALGNADWFNWLFLGAVQGLAQGFSIRIAQEFGAGNERGMQKSMASILILYVLCAAAVTLIAQLTIVPVQILIGTPHEIVGMSRLYLRIMFAGLPVTLAYNLAACLLRALGDARTPLIAMVISSVFNIAADILFVAGFEWGVAGAAAATVMAQIIATVFCFVVLSRIRMLRPRKEDFTWDGTRLKELMSLGLPISAQNIIIAVGGVMVQSVVNRFGVTFIAGYTATNKLYGLLEIAAVSYGYAMTTYAGQNLGAGEYQRIRQGVRAATVLGILTSFVISAFMILLGKPILLMFLSGEAQDVEAALKVAYEFLFLMSAFLSVLYVLHVLRSSLQGLGNTFNPMLSGILELVARLLSAFLLTRMIGETGLFWCEILAWAGADVVLIAGYIHEIRKLKNKMIGNEVTV